MTATRGWMLLVLGLVFWFGQTWYFGWNITAQSGAEVACDVISAVMIWAGFSWVVSDKFISLCRRVDRLEAAVWAARMPSAATVAGEDLNVRAAADCEVTLGTVRGFDRARRVEQCAANMDVALRNARHVIAQDRELYFRHNTHDGRADSEDASREIERYDQTLRLIDAAIGDWHAVTKR